MRLKAFVPYLIILSIIVCIIWLSTFYINDLLVSIVISSLSITYVIVIVVFCVNLLKSEKENAKKDVSLKTSEDDKNKEIEAKNKEIEAKNIEISKLKEKAAHLQQRIFDISESYSTKIIENLREANNRNIFIESVLNNIRINVYSLNKEGYIVSVNNEILRNFGLEKDKVIGEKYDFFKFIEYERIRKIYEDKIYENINNYEETILIKSHKIDILKTISVVFGEENEFLGAVVSFVDVSNLKSLQRILNAINKQNQDILNNIKSGIISVGKDVIIKSQYSKFVEYLFPDREISGSILDEFLLKNINNPEIEDYIKSLIDIVLNRKRTPVSTINSMPIVSEFPTIITEQNVENSELKQKYYKLNFERIYENDEITGAMLIIDDITDQKLLKENLKKEQEAHQKEIELIYQLLKVNPQICKDSINESYKNLANIKTLLDSKNWDNNPKIDKEYLNVLTRYSHSIKGLTKMLSMSDSSNSAHQLETIFTQQRDKNDIPIKNFISQIKENLKKLEESLKKETSLANKILGIETEGSENITENVITIETEKLNKLLSNYNNLTLYLTRSQAIPKSLLLKLLDSIHRIKRGSIIPFVEMLNEMIKNIGKSLGKKINNIKILGNTTEMDYKVLRTLKDPIIHIIRNILDHGVEYPELRINKGKPDTGNITMTIKEDETFLSLIIADDGAGIDMVKLKEKANKLGIECSNEKKLINLIFIDGFSTKDVATEISGRGVGMSVVKEAVRSLGGKLYIKSVQDKGTSIIMKIPLSIIPNDYE